MYEACVKGRSQSSSQPSASELFPTYKVAWHPSSVLSQRHEEQWENRCAHVPRNECERKIWEVSLIDVPQRRHLFSSGAVSTRRDPEHDGSVKHCQSTDAVYIDSACKKHT
jgi:hypothetical protein